MEHVCADNGGVHFNHVHCDPYPCPTPWACCLPDGMCKMWTLDECAAQGGEFMGAQTLCDPNPCGVAGVLEELTEPGEEVTWGRIKSRYRD